jgi:hypothetical protein|tara:strand:- start:3375 stop:3515 length:141 start_codon:yes stop_codon:yes gene_type:complete
MPLVHVTVRERETPEFVHLAVVRDEAFVAGFLKGLIVGIMVRVRKL